jgi:uncharacterized protein YbjT (DUF2867 family)
MTTHLIIGGTGKSGRRVVDRLTREGATVRSLFRPTFDWSEPATWNSVAIGAPTAYLTYAPDVALPGAAEAVADVAHRLLASGTRRVVLLSGRGEPGAQRAEELLQKLARDHQASWAVVRCAFFMQNFSEGTFAEPLAAGELAFPADQVREPFVDLDDVADVVSALLVGHAPADQVYELTGPHLLTFRQATALIAAAADRDVNYLPVTMAGFVSGLLEAGVPDDLAHSLGELFAHVLDGHNESLADGIQRALGRPPHDFETFAAAAARSGAWQRTAAAL